MELELELVGLAAAECMAVVLVGVCGCWWDTPAATGVEDRCCLPGLASLGECCAAREGRPMCLRNEFGLEFAVDAV